jgi:hypothetical protein
MGSEGRELTSLRILRACLVLLTLSIAGGALRLLLPGGEFTAVSADPVAGLRRTGRSHANPDSLARLISARNPFRASRAPALVAFDPRVSGMPGVPPTPPAPPRPQLVLAGILLGPPHAALIEGLPGIEGARVMRAGERFGEYLLRAIASDHVLVAGRDTTWTLRLRNRYQ